MLQYTVYNKAFAGIEVNQIVLSVIVKWYRK